MVTSERHDSTLTHFSTLPWKCERYSQRETIDDEGEYHLSTRT